MAFHHGFKGVKAGQVLVVVVGTQQLVEFPNLLQGFGLEFHAIIAHQFVKALERGLYPFAVKKREIRAGRLQMGHKVATCGGPGTGGLTNRSAMGKRLF